MRRGRRGEEKGSFLPRHDFIRVCVLGGVGRKEEHGAPAGMKNAVACDWDCASIRDL